MRAILEHAGEFLLQGWAVHEKDPAITVSLDIFINRQFTARVPAGTFRGDLLAEGYGTGHHAFFFNPFEYLSAAENLVEVREASSGTLISSGERRFHSQLATDRDAYRKAQALAYSRWQEPVAADPRAEELFFDRLQVAAHFHPALRILELGPGAGSLLEAVLSRDKPFSTYLGLDLSREAVNALDRRLGHEEIRFLTGDASRYPLAGRFDLAIASSVCDSLFPSLLPALHNIGRVLESGGLLVFDLVAEDDRMSISRATWQGNRFLRIYSVQEIRRSLAEAGFELLQSDIYQKAETEHRMFVTAVKMHPRTRGITA